MYKLTTVESQIIARLAYLNALLYSVAHYAILKSIAFSLTSKNQ